MLQEIDYRGSDEHARENIKETMLKMVEFSLELVDMAEECLDPRKTVAIHEYVQLLLHTVFVHLYTFFVFFIAAA